MIKSPKPVRGHKYLRKPLLLQRVSDMLRPVQGSCGWEWAFEGKPNCFCTVGATESVSVNKAGMCWHITRGRGRSRQCWVAPQECKILPLLSQCTNVFWDRSVFYFLSRSYFGLDCKV